MVMFDLNHQLTVYGSTEGSGDAYMISNQILMCRLIMLPTFGVGRGLCFWVRISSVSALSESIF